MKNLNEPDMPVVAPQAAIKPLPRVPAPEPQPEPRASEGKPPRFCCFVTGTDTEIGKTTIAAGLLHRARLQGLATAGVKPVASGCERTAAGLRNGDALALLGNLERSRQLWARSAKVQGDGAERTRRLAALFGAIADRKLKSWSYGGALSYYRRAAVLSAGSQGPSAKT